MTTSINYLCRSAEKIRRLKDIEVIVVDWNSEIPLSKELCLVPEASEASRFILVPPNIASKYNLNGAVFNGTCATNAGIRRANGKYVAIMPADILITSASLQNLLLLLEEKLDSVFDPSKTMLNIGRKWIPWQIVEKQPELEEWDRYLQLHSRRLYYDNCFYGLAGGYGAILMQKTLWHQSQGFVENYSGWGWTDIEFGLRINQFYPSIDLICFGILVYDMQQKPELQDQRHFAGEGTISKKINLSNENWGLKKHDLEVQRGPFELNTDHFSSKSDDVTYSRYKVIHDLKNNILRKHIVRKIRGVTPKGNEWACLFPLAWFSLNYIPKKYLEFGISRGYSYLVVSSSISSIEIYAIDPFDNPDVKSAFLPHLNLRRLNHRGYLHFITGDKNTGLNRLKKSFIGQMSFGLVLFRVDMFGGEAISQLKQVMNYLEDNGALVITGNDKQLFAEVWESIQKEFPTYIHLACKTYNTGLILKCDAGVDNDFLDYEKEEKILSRAWKPIKGKLYIAYLLYIVIRLMRRVYHKLIEFVL